MSIKRDDALASVKFYLKDYLHDKRVLQMRSFIQHGNITTYTHCLRVALISYIICIKLNLNVSMSELLVGALLHDYFLYDWHDGRQRPEGLHGFTHPKTALINAECDFNLTERERNIIYSHTFPMTITQVPKCKEAFVVCIADKICATEETVTGFKNNITSLFNLRATNV